jgi:hypothetical protein
VLSLSKEERECWIEALGNRIRRRVETLVGVDTAPEIESRVGAIPNQGGPESAHHRYDPNVGRSAPSPTNQEIEEEL